MMNRKEPTYKDSNRILSNGYLSKKEIVREKLDSSFAIADAQYNKRKQLKDIFKSINA